VKQGSTTVFDTLGEFRKRMQLSVPQTSSGQFRALAGIHGLITPHARRTLAREASTAVAFGGSGLSGAAPDKLMRGRWPL